MNSDNSSDVVVAESLCKQYGSVRAVDGISFSIKAGECFGFVGPNGAGKTTTVKMIYCFSPATCGSLRVFGMDVMSHPREIKALIGVCPQETNLDPDFSVEKNLRVFARYFGISRASIQPRIEELLGFAELSERRNEKVDNLSGGMKRRLLLARALINNPQLLILDEPTTGLDPQARHMIWDRVRELRRQGVTIILTTHYMEEAAQLADRVVIIDHGKIIDIGTPDFLITHHAGNHVLEVWETDAETRKELQKINPKFEFFGSRALLYENDLRTTLEQLQEATISKKIVTRPTGLEDVFLKLTGHELRE